MSHEIKTRGFLPCRTDQSSIEAHFVAMVRSARNWAIAQLPCEQGSPNNGLSHESKALNRKSREEKIYQEDIVTASGKF
jgi:hypothetical protein